MAENVYFSACTYMIQLLNQDDSMTEKIEDVASCSSQGT